MNFNNLYDKLHDYKINCKIIDNVDVKNILFGSGGSSNIILDVENKNEDRFIIKIIPDFIYTNVKIKPDYNQLEIKFYNFFTKKYILTNRTPHIVGLFQNIKCQNISSLLKKIKSKNLKCPTFEDTLTKRNNVSLADYKICDLLLNYEMKLLDPNFDMVLLEYCPIDLSKFLKNTVENIHFADKNEVNKLIINFSYNIYRILFQIIFTMAIIKDDYPGFLHGDFFVRNILLTNVKDHNENDYIAYHYQQRIFYLPANGLYSKINDFGMSIIVNELQNSTYELDKNQNKKYRVNPFNTKNDIFNLLHDIYSGQNIGTISLIELSSKLNINIDKIYHLRNIFKRFIDVDKIDEINLINHETLDTTWFIDGVKTLENTVNSPHEYLVNKTFEIFQELPKNAKIIWHYNSPSL
ncbi:serine/threonine-protein kinase [Megavirus baoshan]|uniref:Putative serine/threonine-protein kinase n=1 Tax=Megavirus baoshan TaxID=2496520 RepID=A0A3S8UWX7_9VIRU|nr:serine/threonine-protein kinase [Megavirus baoshan]AZL89253.1 serine/threonine-protein kinase [Megavirus baoshan]